VGRSFLLENLSSVEALIVSDNPSLESLDALRGLESAREIRIEQSPRSRASTVSKGSASLPP
jgi:hypothetical protein